MNKAKSITTTLSASLLLIIGCKESPQKGAIPPMRIESAVASTQRLSDKIHFSTSTEPLRSATIEPRVNGYLQSIEFSSGEPISEGEVIFRIDPTQIETELLSARAAVESAQATLIEARNNYHRAEPLARINAISQSSFDEYTASYRSAEAELKSAEQSLKNAELNLSYTTLRAPFDGLIAESPAAVGDYVGPGSSFATLTTISQIDTLVVTLAIPTARYLKYIASTQNSFNNSQLLSDITLILPDSTAYKYNGIYDYTQKSASNENSTIGIVAKIPNPDAMLKSEMFVRATADIGAATPRILVPQSAVTQIQGESSVWIIEPDSTVAFRTVELGSTYGDEWQIKKGVTNGERVATSGQLKLHEGAKVIPISNIKKR